MIPAALQLALQVFLKLLELEQQGKLDRQKAQDYLDAMVAAIQGDVPPPS